MVGERGIGVTVRFILGPDLKHVLPRQENSQEAYEGTGATKTNFQQRCCWGLAPVLTPPPLPIGGVDATTISRAD